MLAIVDIQAQPWRVHAAGAAAQRMGGLEYRYRVAGAVQVNGGAKARPARADHAYLHLPRRLTTLRPPLTQVFQASQNLRMGVSEMR